MLPVKPILIGMSIFATALPAKLPRTKDSGKVAIMYAVILVVFAVAQLYTFEEFLPYILSLDLPLGNGLSSAFAPLLIASEVFAVPFLLRMRLSPAFTYFSMGLGWVAALAWIFVSIWLNVGGVSAETVGFLGTVVTLAPGLWAVFISFALGILATWSSWGLWPGKRSDVKSLSN